MEHAFCLVCESEFEQVNKNHKYCSVKCQNIKRSDGSKCPICYSIVPVYNSKYCSRTCASEGKKIDEQDLILELTHWINENRSLMLLRFYELMDRACKKFGIKNTRSKRMAVRSAFLNVYRIVPVNYQESKMFVFSENELDYGKFEPHYLLCQVLKEDNRLKLKNNI